jgi:hypothetical protein
MKINSNLKDYYDYVANLYGGGDPNILYLRTSIGEKKFTGTLHYYNEVSVEFDRYFKLPEYNYGSVKGYPHGGGFKGLVVAGRMFPIIDTNANDENHWRYQSNNKFEVFDYNKHEHLLNPRTRFESRRDDYSPYWESRKVSESLIKLSRKLGHPVFIINRVNNYVEKTVIIVSGECPILSNVGLAQYFPAEQLYQELSYFLGNLVKESPDMMPRPKVTDKDKILSHGFDLKQSFRHRK